jgi:hypothetical protein
MKFRYWIIGAFVVFYVLKSPRSAAGSVHQLMELFTYVGTQGGKFLSALLGN